MNACEKIKQLMIPHLLGETQSLHHHQIENHLRECPRCHEEFTQISRVWNKLADVQVPAPSTSLANSFHSVLTQYQRSHWEIKPTRSLPLGSLSSLWFSPVWRVAAAAVMIIITFFSGLYFGNAFSSRAQLAQLQSELDDTRRLAIMSLMKQSSSSDRLQAIYWSEQWQESGDDMQNALEQALRYDPNTNVRLAALRALQPLAHQAQVRHAIVTSFDQQTSPLMQIEIIDFICMAEDAPEKILLQLKETPRLHTGVRQHIEWNLKNLKTPFHSKEN